MTRTLEPQDGRPARHVYTLTDVGRELLHDQLADLPDELAGDEAEFLARLAGFGRLTPSERRGVLAARSRVLAERRTRLAGLAEATAPADTDLRRERPLGRPRARRGPAPHPRGAGLAGPPHPPGRRPHRGDAVTTASTPSRADHHHHLDRTRRRRRPAAAALRPRGRPAHLPALRAPARGRSGDAGAHARGRRRVAGVAVRGGADPLRRQAPRALPPEAGGGRARLRRRRHGRAQRRPRARGRRPHLDAPRCSRRPSPPSACGACTTASPSSPRVSSTTSSPRTVPAPTPWTCTPGSPSRSRSS